MNSLFSRFSKTYLKDILGIFYFKIIKDHKILFLSVMSDLIHLFHIALQRYHGDCNKGESVPKTSK